MRVQSRMCDTCVYRKGSPLDPSALEDRIRSPRGDFDGYRICHSSRDACCAGFWRRYKDLFAWGQIAQRLGLVELVRDKVPTRIAKQVADAWKERHTE